MNPTHVLAFAADPLSAPPNGKERRLRADEEMRLIREKLRAAAFGDLVTFDTRWAARPDDLLQGLNETHPAVVHFSGHANESGLVLVGRNGRPHSVDGPTLARLFTDFKPWVRVVVLSACLTLPLAEAIAEVVGCAIGTRNEISDAAAIEFGAAFYRAIAFGHSVQGAFEQARTALALHHHDDSRYPELVARQGVDPSRLMLLQGPPQQPLPGPGDAGFWRELTALLTQMYPSGPREQHVWERADGDPSRLLPGTSGRTAWYDAVSMLRRGGGGATVASLLREAREDYPLNTGLWLLVGQQPDVVPRP